MHTRQLCSSAACVWLAFAAGCSSSSGDDGGSGDGDASSAHGDDSGTTHDGSTAAHDASALSDTGGGHTEDVKADDVISTNNQCSGLVSDFSPECNQCTEDKCCAEVMACANDPTCAQYKQCWFACHAVCEPQCAQQYPTGAAASKAYAACQGTKCGGGCQP